MFLLTQTVWGLQYQWFLASWKRRSLYLIISFQEEVFISEFFRLSTSCSRIAWLVGTESRGVKVPRSCGSHQILLWKTLYILHNVALCKTAESLLKVSFHYFPLVSSCTCASYSSHCQFLISPAPCSSCALWLVSLYTTQLATHQPGEYLRVTYLYVVLSSSVHHYVALKIANASWMG